MHGNRYIARARDRFVLQRAQFFAVDPAAEILCDFCGRCIEEDPIHLNLAYLTNLMLPYASCPRCRDVMSHIDERAGFCQEEVREMLIQAATVDAMAEIAATRVAAEHLEGDDEDVE
jgi:hypothetical protein